MQRLFSYAARKTHDYMGYLISNGYTDNSGQPYVYDDPQYYPSGCTWFGFVRE